MKNPKGECLYRDGQHGDESGYCGTKTYDRTSSDRFVNPNHILLEGVPGLAKTLAIKSLANIINAKFSRIQFTPDLLPADLIGTLIYSQKSEEFIVKRTRVCSFYFGG